MVESMELGRNPKYQRTSLLCIRVRVFRFLFKQEQFSSNENQTTPSSSILSILRSLYTLTLSKLQMSSSELISYDEAQNSAFDNVLHRKSKESKGGMRAMINKDNRAHAAAVDEYFQFWDNKKAEDEVEAVRQERTDNYASLTRQ